MLVGEIKSQIQSIWNDFWAGGLSNPLAVMEQITLPAVHQAPGRVANPGGKQGDGIQHPY